MTTVLACVCRLRQNTTLEGYQGDVFMIEHPAIYDLSSINEGSCQFSSFVEVIEDEGGIRPDRLVLDMEGYGISVRLRDHYIYEVSMG